VEVRKGVEVVFLRTGVKVTADNFNDPSILIPNFFGGLLASQESKKKSGWIMDSWMEKKEAIKAGKAVNLAHLPAWLVWDKEAGKVVVNESKAEIVRKIFELACQGCGPREIVRTLRDSPPITDRKKAKWNPATVARILRDKAAIGYSMIVDPPVPGIYPPIVSEQVFYSATKRLETAPRVTAHSGNVTNLFTGLVKCAECGAPSIVHRYSGEKLGLLCAGRRYGQSDCGSSCIPLALFEAATLALLANSDLIRPLLTGPAKAASKLDELAGRLAESQKQVAKLTRLIIGDDEPPRALYDELKAQEATVKVLSGQLEDERARARAERPAAQEYDEFVASLPALAADTARRAELRRAIGAVVERISIQTKGAKGARGARVWTWLVSLRGMSELVTVIAVSKPLGWCFRSLRPPELGG